MDIKVSIIGSGNVATHLGRALKNCGATVLHIWSQNLKNAEILAESIQSTAVKSIDDIANDGSDLVIISVKDDVISAVASALIKYEGLVVHTSGAVGLADLSFLQNYGVFYPLQTFSKHKELNFNEVPICLEANNNDNLQILKNVATALSQKVYEVPTDQRKILHLAAVFACNFPNYLYGVAQQLLAAHQLSFDIIRPLIAETANKVQTALPMEVQTGPAVRNDEQTMVNHQKLLQENPDWVNIYQLLSDQIKKRK
jgi:predicted short-subunit dehydrogenase-like oxidoreductase (DUF2520 family)